ncbi:GNAT family N-acetyltransferase [Tateyamaria omphalii]|uniref:GNAT family N-acetyltransferase n=1 Tax=Tateyamaria omphalii TaxID=299262 RepID=UPI001C9A0CAB|nr:GNAT family N-acetyltransferase [Tateyamaria omphalii]MBY5935412.1 GNAT family N-acetyltransferase [Tateyamaria omphalii]
MLETERLILRHPVADDLDALADMFADPVVTAHIGGMLSRAEAWSRLLRDVGHWTLEGFGQFIITHKATGSFVGKVGFAKYERDLGPRVDTDVECSWTLRSACHGHGYATEAALGVHQWHDRQRPGPTACMIALENAASRKLAAALGYVEVDRRDAPTGSSVVLQRPAPRDAIAAGVRPQP